MANLEEKVTKHGHLNLLLEEQESNFGIDIENQLEGINMLQLFSLAKRTTQIRPYNRQAPQEAKDESVKRQKTDESLSKGESTPTKASMEKISSFCQKSQGSIEEAKKYAEQVTALDDMDSVKLPAPTVPELHQPSQPLQLPTSGPFQPYKPSRMLLVPIKNQGSHTLHLQNKANPQR